MKKIFLNITLLLLVISCNNTNNIFNGKFSTVTPNNITEIVEEEIKLDLYGFYSLHIVDTFLIARSEINDGRFTSIFNITDFKNYGRYILKGNGANEFLYITIMPDSKTDSSGSKIWINDQHKKEMVLFNISKSISNNKTVIDKRIKLNNVKTKQVYAWNHVNDSVLIGYTQGVHEAERRIIKYNFKADSIISDFNMYNGINPYSVFFGQNLMKPDGEKVVNSMMFFDQLNFHSFNDNISFSVSTANLPVDVATLNDPDFMTRRQYYFNSWCDNNFIVASYFGDRDKLYCTELHIFDWNGELQNIIKMKNKFKHFVIDNKTKDIYLYGIEEKVYKSNLSEYLEETN